MQLASTILFLLALASLPHAQTGTVLRTTKLSHATVPGLQLADGDGFGTAVTTVGDLDGNGVDDLAVGAPGDDLTGPDRGAVHLLFLDSRGTVLSQRRIDGTSLRSSLEEGAAFGSALASLRDLDGDGRRELLIGAPASGNPLAFGRVYLLGLDATGTVTRERVITAGSNGFALPLQPGDRFGRSLGVLGDLDGNGVDDLAVGGGPSGNGGTFYTLRLGLDGRVRNAWQIGNHLGGLEGLVSPSFASSLVGVGDLNHDGIPDVAVGQNDGHPSHGATWLLHLDPRGRVQGESLLNGHDDMFGAVWEARSSRFGEGVAALGDLNADGTPDLAVGGPFESNRSCFCAPDAQAVPEAGAVWVLLSGPAGVPTVARKINTDEGGLDAMLEAFDHFGTDVDRLGDLNGDGRTDLVAGAPGDDDGGPDRGAVYLLELDAVPFPAAATVSNGSHANALCLRSRELPRLGGTWSVEVDASVQPGAAQVLLGVHAQPAAVPIALAGGELLIDPSSPRLLFSARASSGALDVLRFPIPADLALQGATGTGQALLLGGGWQLCNALALELGS